MQDLLKLAWFEQIQISGFWSLFTHLEACLESSPDRADVQIPSGSGTLMPEEATPMVVLIASWGANKCLPQAKADDQHCLFCLFKIYTRVSSPNSKSLLLYSELISGGLSPSQDSSEEKPCSRLLISLWESRNKFFPWHLHYYHRDWRRRYQLVLLASSLLGCLCVHRVSGWRAKRLKRMSKRTNEGN